MYFTTFSKLDGVLMGRSGGRGCVLQFKKNSGTFGIENTAKLVNFFTLYENYSNLFFEQNQNKLCDCFDRLKHHFFSSF